MEPVKSEALIEFLTRLGDLSPSRMSLYLLGGSALSILGNPRQTLDIDYTTDLQDDDQKEFEKLVKDVAAQLRLDVEAVPLGEFIPLPPGAANRMRYLASYGNMDVYLFDLYSIALSKIARGFESDLEDVLFLLRGKLIVLDDLESYFKSVLPEAHKADIDQREFRQYFEEVKRRYLQ